ncbi:divergent polysaccharide deacetylase family protein [Avibacterium paragallinarum]|uniref:Divergent polysaccharide deacetylase family protein n=1 Tax=Avibacterium paragallinarum TaxID=728 RepID=A0AAE5THC2_AVIPA|nr:divergent polysaccharide deacetylase family protein [Avibacterium paragallinarum]MEE3609606.1 divergent polysaccharide deacetylase family protein [Avibacterium paragallinarum]MEE3621544.1 divergent polysaccharide deacetylase family protein [Avibacterium paragallinarum]MEE3669250.1 divergent polysaccharide deacetylase family protein [Avibacterium paragallinarum]MEE3681728.1 divergent polysaccharide deacetylase family protein [Avibacterium paragallinarum]MEE4386970.1 divergent polysaccharide 
MKKLMHQSAVKISLLFSILCFSHISFSQSKLAIIIDDIGYRSKEDAAIYAMPKEISVAIIPSAPYAKQRNELAKQQHRDVLIHLPMQPLGKHKIEAGALTLGMTQDSVQEKIQNAKKIISAAIGLNNHMGSAATSDKDLMNKLMIALKEQNLFFLDSKTIGHSVANKIAKQQGVNTLERNIFLDNSDKLIDVQNQFQQAIHYARKHGVAVVIGHPRKNTILVLQHQLHRLPEDIQLVNIGSLWRKETIISPAPFIMLFNTIPAPTSQAPFEKKPLLRGIPY